MTRNILVLVPALTFLHHVAAQMRSPVLPLHVTAHGGTATAVGLVMGAHMAVAAAGSIPLGRASDAWGPRWFLLGGIAITAITSLLLPLTGDPFLLLAIYGVAGVGIAAFTPSALSLVSDAAPPGKIGRAIAWYSTAHYSAIAFGPFLGGLASDSWGHGAAFLASGAGAGVALAVGFAAPTDRRGTDRRPSARFADIRRNPAVWAGWSASIAGLLLQGAVFTFFPLLGHRRGLTPAGIGLVFLVLGLANTFARVPAGWLVDRSRRQAPYAVAGLLAASIATAVLPLAHDRLAVLAIVAVFGAASGIAFVAIGVALATAAPAALRGLVMGGYSTALYLGLALGSFALGPIITHRGHPAGFAAGALAGAAGTLVAGALWLAASRRRDRSA